MWRPDKGLSPFNALATIIELGVLAALCWMYIPKIILLLDPSLGFIYSLLSNLDTSISQRISPFDLLLLSSLMLVSFARMAWIPNNNHVVLFLTLFLFACITVLPSAATTNSATLIISGCYIVAILIDSFNMAFKDELTGIPSRRALMQYVQTLGRKYVVVMSDIDHFKKFNDTYGHDVGDQVLKLVASKLNSVTGGGKAFRYGGEEFTIIFPRKSIEQVQPHVEVLRQIIADYEIILRSKDRPDTPPKSNKKTSNTKQKNKTVEVTCSFGVAEKSASTQEFSSIMKKADVALYAAKKAGRNCVKQDTAKG